MTIHNLRCEAMQEGDVRIDRRTSWGNRFVMRSEADRADVIDAYRRDLWERLKREAAAGESALRESVAALHGKRLFCWCAPLPCHGDVLARAAAHFAA